MIRQVIIIRKDLGMRKGKMIAQGAHASMKVFFDRLQEVGDSKFEIGPEESWDWHGEVLPWINGKFTKIVLQCGSEEELLALRDEAQNQGLPHALIQDVGDTEFKGVPTYTALAIGPASRERLNPITGSLKLF